MRRVHNQATARQRVCIEARGVSYLSPVQDKPSSGVKGPASMSLPATIRGPYVPPSLRRYRSCVRGVPAVHKANSATREEHGDISEGVSK